MLKVLKRLVCAIWTNPFKIDDLKFEPVEEGTETSGYPEDVFEQGDWVTLGFIEPERPMDWDEFLESLYREEKEILRKTFETVKRNLERRGYDVEKSYKPLFHVEPADKPRIWYIVKKRGKPVAYCDIVIHEGEGERPYAEVSTVCMSVPEKVE